MCEVGCEEEVKDEWRNVNVNDGVKKECKPINLTLKIF